MKIVIIGDAGAGKLMARQCLSKKLDIILVDDLKVKLNTPVKLKSWIEEAIENPNITVKSTFTWL